MHGWFRARRPRPGIANLEMAMEDFYSTGRGLGSAGPERAG